MVSRNDSEMEITEQEFSELINNSHKLVVVDFFGEWCMGCLIISPILEELAEQIKEVKFVKINVDDNQELAQKYNVSHLPCLIIFKDGKEVEKMAGAQIADIIEEKINKWL